MNSPVIRAEGLGKEYVIGAREAGRESFREMLTSSFAAPFRRFRRLSGEAAPEERIWALKDVSFEVAEGEVVGIIGRNGAGKSTLLKILSRITEPTEGRAVIRGRVASLLEVGTGFHPELTGRENIHLNGAILGMSWAEIDRKFDEIVAFAEIEKFLDTPVKRYSSGMAVRLAFAVAAHLDPEILLVDEVLAVGDAAFQKKCLGKMQEVSGKGRTVLFVSHNMDSIRKLCGRAIYLNDGGIRCDSAVDNCVSVYVGEQRKDDRIGHIIPLGGESADSYFVERMEILDAEGRPHPYPRTWDEVTFRIVFHSPEALKSGSVVLQIATLSGTVLLLCSTQPDHQVLTPFNEGMNIVECRIPKLLLSAGRYLIGAGLAIPKTAWLYQNLDGGILEVHERDVFLSGMAPSDKRYCVPMEHHWITIS